MFTWFPNGTAAAWLSQNAWLVSLAVVVVATGWTAMCNGISSDGWSDTSSCDDDGGSCDGD